jgi:hypothetical protein
LTTQQHDSPTCGTTPCERNMSNTQASASPTPSGGTGAAQRTENQSIENFAASLSTGAVVFGAQMLIFLILSGNWKLHKTKASTEKSTERQGLFHKI